MLGPAVKPRDDILMGGMTWLLVVPWVGRGIQFGTVFVGGGPGGVQPLLGAAVRPRAALCTGRDGVGLALAHSRAAVEYAVDTDADGVD